jgi:hypothetical protein
MVEDDSLGVLLEFGGRNIINAPEDDPIRILRNQNMSLRLELENKADVPLNMSGTVWFYYNDIAVLPIQVQNPVTGQVWVQLPHNATIDPINTSLPIEQLLSIGPVDLLTGIIQASLEFNYYEMDPTNLTRSGILHSLIQVFYLELPPADALGVITSVAGIAATVATAGAVFSLGTGIKAILEGLQTAHKLRSIQKKASEIRSLPNLTVLGALPALFALVAGMKKLKKKKKKKGEEIEETATSEGVSEYVIRQRIREVAPDAWPMDKCPKCKKAWSSKQDTCRKCGIDIDTAQRAYADLLVSKVEPALKVMNKKKSLSVRKLAKKTKSNDYNAGVVGAAMVDTEVTEVTKLRSFVMNIGGLAFLMLTWQQLLGGAASHFQTTLTLVGGAFSLAVIVALALARRTQIEKFRADMEVTGKMMPTEEEIAEADEPSEEEVDTEAVVESDIGDDSGFDDSKPEEDYAVYEESAEETHDSFEGSDFEAESETEFDAEKDVDSE